MPNQDPFPYDTKLSQVPVGQKVMISGNCYAWRAQDGSVYVRGKIEPKADRSGYENHALRAVEGFDRAHAFPAAWGNESPAGIAYASAEQNRSMEKRIENHVRAVHDVKPANAELWCTVQTIYGKGSQLQSRVYSLEMKTPEQSQTLFEVELEMRRDRVQPIVHRVNENVY